MRLSQSARFPTGRVDAFSDVVRCFVDWQSSRSRRALSPCVRHRIPVVAERVLDAIAVVGTSSGEVQAHQVVGQDGGTSMALPIRVGQHERGLEWPVEPGASIELRAMPAGAAASVDLRFRQKVRR